MKRLLLGSMIAASLLLTTGCNDDDTPADRTAPVVQTADFSMAAGATQTITANEASTFALIGDAQGFVLTSAGNLTAPAVANTYALAIKATDTAGNVSETKTINVTVTEASGGTDTGGGEDTAVVVGEVVTLGGNDWVKVQTADTPDDETTADVNETTFAKVTYADAVAYCTGQGAGWTLPAAADFLTIQTSSETDIENMNGQLVLDPSILAAGTSATTSALWVSDADYQIVYLGDANNSASTYVQAGETEDGVTTPASAFTYFHTCIKPGS